ncbi:MAG: hypothetical protein AAFN11_09340 [Chloroflexota bacterium]
MQERLSEVQAQYVDELMAKANVVGVGIGLAKEGDEFTDELAIVVMVEQKLPVAQLAEEDIIPSELEGFRVDVQETGPIQAF